ncbi:hypothetical protein ACHQM5_010737 [Ranunculus cassubicifolius]
MVLMNFNRKSTVGWSIGFILLDFLAGVTSLGQMVLQSIDQCSWVNFEGNIGKPLLCLVSIFFDIIFIIQHYVLYPSKTESITTENDNESTPLLAESSQKISEAGNV